MDLRSIGAPSLPVMAGKKRHQLVGPLILQLQKVKNVAVSPSKQNSQSSKRFLRLELTDGHKNISAVELQGPIDQLRYQCGAMMAMVDNLAAIRCAALIHHQEQRSKSRGMWKWLTAFSFYRNPLWTCLEAEWKDC